VPAKNKTDFQVFNEKALETFVRIRPTGERLRTSDLPVQFRAKDSGVPPDRSRLGRVENLLDEWTFGQQKTRHRSCGRAFCKKYRQKRQFASFE
jgi:hypothetical protein